MANAGFNKAVDIFSMGNAWKVKSSDMGKTISNAEAVNNQGDVTHRDSYAERIAPTAEYELCAAATSLPALGTVVTIESRKVAISSITIATAPGAAPTASVSGVQVEDDASTGRTYSCGTLSLSTRHRAQDILGWCSLSEPSNLSAASFTFEVDVTLSEPKGVINASDASNGRVTASYTFVSGDGAAVSAPTVSGSRVMSAPVSVSCPENDYMQTTFSIMDSLTGSEASSSS